MRGKGVGVPQNPKIPPPSAQNPSLFLLSFFPLSLRTTSKLSTPSLQLLLACLFPSPNPYSFPSPWPSLPPLFFPHLTPKSLPFLPPLPFPLLPSFPSPAPIRSQSPASRPYPPASSPPCLIYSNLSLSRSATPSSPLSSPQIPPFSSLRGFLPLFSSPHTIIPSSHSHSSLPNLCFPPSATSTSSCSRLFSPSQNSLLFPLFVYSSLFPPPLFPLFSPKSLLFSLGYFPFFLLYSNILSTSSLPFPPLAPLPLFPPFPLLTPLFLASGQSSLFFLSLTNPFFSSLPKSSFSSLLSLPFLSYFLLFSYSTSFPESVLFPPLNFHPFLSSRFCYSAPSSFSLSLFYFSKLSSRLLLVSYLITHSPLELPRTSYFFLSHFSLSKSTSCFTSCLFLPLKKKPLPCFASDHSSLRALLVSPFRPPLKYTFLSPVLIPHSFPHLHTASSILSFHPF
ncbi:hypothetical protein C7M84_011719 [Penaeus vannamei]|uniref:Uncharacterized protein n=1 Tax=Penaeus vannamei TaxID=6689 RepID=A0A3R7PL39_PENVA|nr:hypothetical protein C7M84_011719 [Penaeus vannamei]